MSGQGAPSEKVEIVALPTDLFGLCQHIAKHLQWEPKEMIRTMLVMGAAQIANDTQIRCVQVDLLEYIERHGNELGVTLPLCPDLCN